MRLPATGGDHFSGTEMASAVSPLSANRLDERPQRAVPVSGQPPYLFQYSPFDVQTGLNYWGHFETADFVHYQYHQPALCSDEQFDCHGVYSGSALENDGVLYLFYTGNVKKTGDGYDYVNNGREHNTIRACSRDGVNFGEKTLLLSNSDYPGNVTCHVRDPKIWKEGDTYYMIQGARTKEDVGQALIFESKR